MSAQLLNELGFQKTTLVSVVATAYFVGPYPYDVADAVYAYDEQKRHWILREKSYDEIHTIAEKLEEYGYRNLGDTVQFLDSYLIASEENNDEGIPPSAH